MKETKNTHHWDMSDDVRAKKLAEARSRYGKPFVTETLIPRSTEPSFVLREIMRRSEDAIDEREGIPGVMSNRDRAPVGSPISLRARGSVIMGLGIQEEFRKAVDLAENEEQNFVVFEQSRYA